MKTCHLTQNREFLRIYRRGKSVVHPLLVTYASPNRMGVNRIGITTSKKIGNAVARNRARRIIRAAFGEQETALNQGWDLVFVARGQTPHSTSPQISAVMRKHLERLGLLNACEDGL